MRLRIVLMLVLILCGHRMYAQMDFGGEWNALFKNVSLPKAAHRSCLWDFGFTDTMLLKFKGTDKDDTAGFEQWSDIYEYWRNSVMDTLLLPREKTEIISWFNAYFKRGLIVVPAILAEGAGIKKDAFESGRLLLDSIHPDIFVVDPVNAFEDQHVFITAPFVQSFYQPMPVFYFSDSFFFTNAQVKVVKITYQLNDGPFIEATMNHETPLGLNPGNNVLVVQFLLSNGTIFRSKSRLLNYERHASFGTEQLMPPQIGDEFRHIYTTPYRTTEKQEPLGAYIEVLPGFDNGVAHACITKPLIFVEGIDFGYKDHPTGCYGGKCGSMGLRDLMRGQIYHPYETKIKDIMETWGPIAKAPKLIEELRQAGYDLIYLDFHNGADYIENNAMLLVELIKRVNFIKCSDEEISIIGASMGGLVTRFALTYMEKHNMPHCVRTFISFDAPQNGANIPIGMQHCLKYYRKKLPGIRDKFDRKLDRAASRQMLVLHCLSLNGYKEHGDRIDFVSKLGALGMHGGYPVNCRKVSVINGSINAQGQDFRFGDKLLEMNPYLGTFNFDILEISCKVYANYAQVEGRNVVLIAQFPFKKKLVVDMPYILPQLDHVPGSLRYDLEESRAIYGLFNVINKEDATCFIPTYSAIGLYQTDEFIDLMANLPRNRPDSKKHPFEAYYGETTAQEHMMLTDGNIEWILEQLETNRNEVPNQLSVRYNFGRRQRTIVNQVNIVQNGVLAVNGKGRTGFGNGSFDQVNLIKSTFDLFTSDCMPHIKVFNGGKIEIGASFADGGNIGRLHVKKGAVLEFMPGSILLINDYSELIIEEGGELIINDNVQILLNGRQSKIRIDGRLRLKDNSTLSIESSPGLDKGFLHFRNIGGGYGAAAIITEGPHIKVDIKGSAKNHQVLQIEGDIRFGVLNPLLEFRIENGIVSYGDNSTILVLGNTVVKDVTFDHLEWATTKRNVAMQVRDFSYCHIVNSVYQKFSIGLSASSIDESAVIKIENSKFIACQTALDLDVNKALISHSQFSNNSEYAVIGHSKLKALSIQSSVLTHNTTGLKLVESDGKALLFVKDADFGSNRLANELKHVEAVYSCTRFLGNETAIYATEADLNLSSMHITAGMDMELYGGDNTFVQYSGAALWLNGCTILLEGGGNNFVHQNQSNQTKLIKGYVHYTLSSHELQVPYKLKGAGNYWYPVPHSGIENSNQALYDLTLIYSGQDMANHLVTGSNLRKLNSVCYNEGPCQPCDLVEDSVSQWSNSHASAFTVYAFPQPADDKLYIETNDSLDMVLGLYSMDGRCIIPEVTVESNMFEISTSHIMTGIYLLKIDLGGYTEWKPIMIRH